MKIVTISGTRSLGLIRLHDQFVKRQRQRRSPLPLLPKLSTEFSQSKKGNKVEAEKLKISQNKLVQATIPFLCLELLVLPFRSQIGVVSISLWGTSLLSRFVSLRKLLTFNLAISASSSGVVSRITTVSRHSGLSLIPHFPLA